MIKNKNMPRKTKKQKILSEYRRKLKQLEELKSSATETSLKQSTYPMSLTPHQSNYLISSAIEKKPASPLDYNQSLVQFTISDLKKTLWLTLLIVGLEFLIFYINVLK